MHAQSLIDDKPGRLIAGGTVNVDERYVAPTVFAEVRLDSKVMSDEIFGPILPVIKIASIEEGLRIVKTMEKPLSLYIFSNNSTVIDQ